MLNPGAALCRTNGVVLSNLWENGQSNSYEDIKERSSFGSHWPNEYFKIVLCFSVSQASATIPTAQNFGWSRYQIGSESRDVCEDLKCFLKTDARFFFPANVSKKFSKLSNSFTRE